MYACICAAITVDEVTQAIDAGAETIEAIGDATEAGTGCGCCHGTLEDLIEERCGTCPLSALRPALRVA